MQSQAATDEIRRKYDEIAPRYDRIDRLFEGTILRRLRRLFGRARGDVLEVAVGTGKNLPYYPPGCRITAVDISEPMLAQARRRADRLSLDATFAVMDAARLDFPDASFDTVTSSLTTCTFVDPVAALREMGRVCRPDGQILLLEHGRSSVAPVGWLQDRFAERHARQAGCWWNRQPQNLVRQAGLQLLTSRRVFLGVYHLIGATPATRPPAV